MALGREEQIKKGNLWRLISQNWSFTLTLVRTEEEDVNVNIDEPIDLTINSFSVFKIEF